MSGDEVVVGGVFSTEIDLSGVAEKFLSGKVFDIPGGGKITFAEGVRVTSDRQRQLLLFDPKPIARVAVKFLLVSTNVETTVAGARIGLDEIIILIDGYPDHKVSLSWS